MDIENSLTAPCKIIQYKTVSSTNTIAKELAKSGEKEFSVIIANAQTAGKGRLGRTFYSPENSGIYMSIILRPDFNAEQTSLITPAAAVAVSRAIEKVCGISAKIKWVNDIFFSGKKICGILTESAVNSKTAQTDYAVLGIGINLYGNDFPEEIKNIAGSIYEKTVSEKTKNNLILQILNEFYEIYRLLPSREFMSEYRKRSLILGKKIVFIKNGQEITATAQSIDDNAHLTVRLENGEICELYSGEISVKLV